MSSIRRQSIISSLVIYTGFAVGLLNTYFFTRQGTANDFSAAQYGLTTIFIAIATMMSAFATMAMPAYIFKFFPYYNDNLPPRKNDLITWALLVSTVGFVLVMIAGWSLKHLVIQKFGTNAPQLVAYYYWIFPMGLGLTIYTVLEAYAWSLHKSIVANFFREVQWRLFTTLLIVLFVTNTIKDFDLFIKLFAFTYPGIAISLLGYLIITKKIHFTFTVSKVSRRFFKKIITLCTFVYGGTLIFTISQVFDTIVIASLLEDGSAKAGKDKNMVLLQKIYQRSSINQLIFACAIFLLIWMNFADGINTFGVKPAYLEAAWLFFILGLTKIIDMGTGVNAQIIATSTYWKFELLSGVVLLLVMLPLTYILTTQYGIIGPAIATMISITIYNILLAAACYGICYFAFKDMHGLKGMFVRSILFVLLYATGVIKMNLTPDILPVMMSIKKRLGIKKYN